MSIRAALRVTAVSGLSALSAGLPAPPAYAVSPPPIDDSRLPRPAAPAPPRPTVQREVCAVPIADPRHQPAPAQLDALDLRPVWELTRGAGQRVAVIDTGVASHRRLPHLVAGGDYVFTGDGTQDCDGHGTLVAGIIGAAPDPADPRGFSGVAPEAAVIAIRQSSTRFGAVADPNRSGSGDVDTMARAVRTAADLDASVINISAVACVAASVGLDDRALGAALAYAVDVKDVVVVAAAGNAGTRDCPAQPADVDWASATVAVSPAWYDDYVLTVGSVDGQGNPSAFTLAGPWVDVAAPGEGVVSLGPVGDGIVDGMGDAIGEKDGPPTISGTGYAAPVVSGLAALIRARFPELTARQVMARITDTAHHPAGGRNPVVGNGIIDPLAAVSIDPLAAVSIDASPPATYPRPGGAPVSPPPPAPAPTDRRARDTAIIGALACLAVLAGVAVTGRLRRAGSDGVAGD